MIATSSIIIYFIRHFSFFQHIDPVVLVATNVVFKGCMPGALLNVDTPLISINTYLPLLHRSSNSPLHYRMQFTVIIASICLFFVTPSWQTMFVPNDCGTLLDWLCAKIIIVFFHSNVGRSCKLILSLTFSPKLIICCRAVSVMGM